MKNRHLALFWLATLLLLSLASSAFHDQIQTHLTSRSLTLFYDVFGRNIFLLTLNAVYMSLITLFPLSIIYLIAGIGLSLILSSFKKDLVIIIFIQSVIDLLSSLPGLLIGLAISAFSSNSIFSVGLATAIMVFPNLIRFFESQINHFKAQDFYSSSAALGATTLHLSIKHLIPELLSLCIAIYPFILSRLLYIETTLAFLGISSVSKTESWGQLINQGRDYLLEAPWLITVSGFTLVLTLWSFHLLTKRESS